MGNIGIEHAVDAGVNAVHGLTAAHVFQIVAGNAFAHVAPLGARLELEYFLFWHLELGSGGDQFAVARFFARLAVHHLVSAGGAFGFGHAPSLRGGANQHESCGSADFTQRVEGTADGMGTVGILVAVFFVTDGLADFHAVPVGVEFVGDDAGKSGLGAAAHFGAVGDGVD